MTIAAAQDWVEKRIRERFGIMKKLDPSGGLAARARSAGANTPRVMVLLVPIFALLVQMLFWRHYSSSTWSSRCTPTR